jgi:hypothetical protein
MSIRWRLCRRRCWADIITDTVEAHSGATHRVCVAYPCRRVIDRSCTTVSKCGARVPAGTRVVLAQSTLVRSRPHIRCNCDISRSLVPNSRGRSATLHPERCSIRRHH